MAVRRLSGRLATGIGVGRTFTSLDWARQQFVDKLGIDPFPGTVNIILDDPDSLPVWMRLKRSAGTRIENPNSGPHDCDAKCWPVTLDRDIEGAIVFPLVEDYPPAQVEVICEVAIRDRLGVEDGDTISFLVKE